MKLLLTGSSGFIGNYFKNKYADTYDMQFFSFLNDDLHALDLKEIDVIIHLSALVHQMGGAKKDDYNKINFENTLNLATKAKKSGVKQFIFMSTVKVYGEETSTAYTEDSVCIPQDEYGKSKLKAEINLKKLEDANFKIGIIRTPIVYGYGVKANIKNLVSLIDRMPILPFGKIHNKRSMVYIGNLCHLIVTIIDKYENGIFLACDDEVLSTTTFIKSIAKTLNKKIYLIKIPFFETMLKIVKPSLHKRLYESLALDNNQTKQTLNFKNLYTQKDGTKFMIYGEQT